MRFGQVLVLLFLCLKDPRLLCCSPGHLIMARVSPDAKINVNCEIVEQSVPTTCIENEVKKQSSEHITYYTVRKGPKEICCVVTRVLLCMTVFSPTTSLPQPLLYLVF